MMDMLDYKPTKQTKDLIKASHFDPSKKVKVVIHGFTNTPDSPWIIEMKDGLLKRVSLSPSLSLSLTFTGVSLLSIAVKKKKERILVLWGSIFST